MKIASIVLILPHCTYEDVTDISVTEITIQMTVGVPGRQSVCQDLISPDIKIPAYHVRIKK